jgi:hypothetical protein
MRPMSIIRTTHTAVVRTLQAQDSWTRQCTMGTQFLVPSGWLRSDNPENGQLTGKGEATNGRADSEF